MHVAQLVRPDAEVGGQLGGPVAVAALHRTAAVLLVAEDQGGPEMEVRAEARPGETEGQGVTHGDVDLRQLFRVLRDESGMVRGFFRCMGTL